MILPSIISEIRGTLGVKIYSRNSHGQYVRDWAPVMQVDTAKQIPYRLAFKDGVAAWQALPDSIKAIYKFRAEQNKYKNSVNVLRSVSGYNYFMRQYMLKYKAGLLPDNTLPTLNTSSRYLLKSINAGLNSLSAGIDHISNTSIGSQYSYFTLIASNGISVNINFPARQLMRSLGTYSFPGTSSNINILPAWESLYGNWANAGQKKVFVGLQTFNIASNQKSSFYYMSIINPNPEPLMGFPYTFPFTL